MKDIRFFRHTHRIAGIVGAICMLLMSLTGLLLNHKPMLSRLTLPATSVAQPGKQPHGPKDKLKTMNAHRIELSTDSDFREIPISFSTALNRAGAAWGPGEPLEKIELKAEKGLLFYRIKAPGEPKREMDVDAYTGAVLKKGSKGPQPVVEQWVKDLHNGKLFGGIGSLVVDAMALLLAFLSLSGFYIWLLPRRRRPVRAAPEA